MAASNLSHRVIPFPTRVSTNPQPQSNLDPNDPNPRLLRAARAAYAALMLALPNGEQNMVIRALGDALRAVDASQQPRPPESPHPPVKRSVPLKIRGAEAAKLLRDLHSLRCECGGAKEARRAFCRRCYFALPDELRAAMWLSPIDDGNHLLDRILTARAHLRGMGMFSGGEHEVY